MKKASILFQTAVMATLLGLAPSLLACPDLQGSYQLAGTEAYVYLQKQHNDYAVVVKGEDGVLSALPVISIPDEARQKEQIPECAVLIKLLGLFMHADKNQSFSVTNQSQEYLNKKKPGTDYVIMVMSGFYSDVIGVNKIASTLPEDVLKTFSHP